MARVDDLLAAYRAVVELPWASGLSAGERTWFVVYEPQDERRLRLRLGEFELATQQAGHAWAAVDLTPAFAQWMAGHEYRESYFAVPEDVQMVLETDFSEAVAARIREAPIADAVGNTVLAVIGVGSLFGLAMLSRVLEQVGRDIPGRLAVFFPGEFDGGNYRLLGARDGWSYLATPILVQGSYA